MVVDVTQVDAYGRADEGVLVANQRVDRLALRPDGPPQLQQLALGVVDGGQQLGLVVTQRRRFQPFQVLAQLLDDRVVAVDDHVDQRVGQVVRSGASDRADAGPDTGADRIEVVALLFL